MFTSNAVIPFNMHGDSHKIPQGWPSNLNHIESWKQFVACSVWVEGAGSQVNSMTVYEEAFQLSHDFRKKSSKTKMSGVSWFINRIGLSHSVFTGVVQKHKWPKKNHCTDMDPDGIVNMDQTQISYSYHSIGHCRRRWARQSMWEQGHWYQACNTCDDCHGKHQVAEAYADFQR